LACQIRREMSARTEQSKLRSVLDTILLLVVVAILSGGIFGFYFFADQPLWVRLAGLLTVVAVAVVLAVQTSPGRALWQFSADSRSEVRKVVWPTRQETLRTLLIVIVAVLLTALFLWAVDSLLFAAVRFLTGQGD